MDGGTMGQAESSLFNNEDLRQIMDMGLTPDKVLDQIESFKKGFPFLTLDRPCSVGDGIRILQPEDLARYSEICSKACLSGRAMKFVPASGAASRMFKVLLAFHKEHGEIQEQRAAAEAEKGEPEYRDFLRFVRGMTNFAFYEDLKAVMARDGLDTEGLLKAGEIREILDYLLTPKGLDLADLPKGLIKFHRYDGRTRTPFEEHLVEAVEYVRDGEGRARIHFTVSPEHESDVRDHVEEVRSLYERPGASLDVEFSIQNPSTDTIAVDMENRPFRDDRGRLVFRPGGHGSLLENLNRLGGDIVFIKNIDNVLPDRRKQDTYTYKRALAGFLVTLQERVFYHLETLSAGHVSDAVLEETRLFARNTLAVAPPETMSREEKVGYLTSKLNRPLRVCGMVRNEGEPGGGPFWVRGGDGTLSFQIVEGSQVDMKSPGQRKIWESATHFNPVDLVCGLRDHEGKPFGLHDFVDPETGFVSIKSMGGRDLKALELPGLWNGAMAKWNTVFVEVPLSTFSPVKTLLDLLREEHQP
jgi:hypothetical protein